MQRDGHKKGHNSQGEHTSFHKGDQSITTLLLAPPALFLRCVTVLLLFPLATSELERWDPTAAGGAGAVDGGNLLADLVTVTAAVTVHRSA
jgi:hypothetical protein